MKNMSITKAFSYFSALPRAGTELKDSSGYERFAIPFTFKPQLSFIEAVIAAAGAFLRVFLGCLLFAVWGAYSLSLCSTIRNTLLRVGVLLLLFIAFLLSFALLMLMITTLVRMVWPSRS